MNNQLNPFARTVRNFIFGFFLTGACLVFAAPDASATHGRASNIIIQPTSNPNQLEIKISQAWRRSFWSNVNVGSQISVGSMNVSRLEGGFSQNLSVVIQVTSVNVAEDWFYGERTFVVNVPSAGTYRAAFNVCCKISTQQNNANLLAYNRATYVLGGGNKSPVSTLPPIVNLPTGMANAQFTVPAFDEDGDPITFRMATIQDYNNNGSFTQPAGMGVDANTGVVSWSTVGRAVGQLWNAVVMVQDDQGAEIMLDFLVRITQQSTPPVFDYTVTPANAAVFTTQPGTAVQFGVRASDNDPGDVVSLQAIGLPSGSSMSPGLPANGNPVESDFSWTPTSGQLGSYIISFIAQDLVGVQTTTTVTINVSLRPQFMAPTPGAGSIFCLEPAQGQSQSGSIVAGDPDPTDVVQITSLSGMPASFVLGGSLPTTAGNPTTLTYDFNPTATDWGQYTLSVTAVDGFNESTTRSWKYIVNDPPTFTSTPVTSVVAGSLYSYTITTADVNTPQGDFITFHHAHRPAWLSFTDNGDGTAILSGTPTIADAGMHMVEIHIEDQLNHIDGTHCGQAHQMFSIEVIPCNIQLVLSGTDPLCNGSIDGSVSISLQNAAAPVQYSWSNGATTSDLTGVGAGTYTLDVLDANGCTASASITLDEPAVLSASASAASFNGGWHVSCNGASDGNITLDVQGGTAPYSYSWSNGAATADLSGVAAGNYTATVTDANGCSVTASISLSEPSALSASASISPDYNVNPGGSMHTIYLGYGSQSVSLHGSATGATPGYSYSWSPSTGLSAPNSANTNAAPTTTTTYTLVVTDQNGCTAIATATVYVVDARCGNNPRNPKVLVCKVPPGNPGNAHEICVAPAAVASHLATGSYVGPCNQGNAGGRMAGASGFDPGDDMVVYPNPSTGLFTIQLQHDEPIDVLIEVYDMKGKRVFAESVPFGSGTEQHQLKLEAEATGMYMLRVLSGQTLHQARIIKQ
ncbi:MAG: T9SS type A sorting domain-containing protein [Bacteroidia bacterium]